LSSDPRGNLGSLGHDGIGLLKRVMAVQCRMRENRLANLLGGAAARRTANLTGSVAWVCSVTDIERLAQAFSGTTVGE
jgi:hypothetical protein